MSETKTDRIGDNPLVQISKLKTDVVDYTGNEEFGKLLEIASRMIAGEVPEPAKVALVCVKLEAMALVFRMQFVSYMGMYKGTTDANMKKNYAKEAYTGIDNLVSSLKYIAK